jgi:hypothetical protein
VSEIVVSIRGTKGKLERTMAVAEIAAMIGDTVQIISIRW